MNYAESKQKVELVKSVHFKKTISFKNIVIFADFVLTSTKMTTLLWEMRIAQLSSANERTLAELF